MCIYEEIFCQELGKRMLEQCSSLQDACAKAVPTKAIEILEKIQNVLQDPTLNDFDMVEEFVHLFETYGLNPGCCHDFG